MDNGENLKSLLSEYPFLVQTGNKVKCELTGHEMPCVWQAIKEYVEGPKYKRIKSIKESFEKYKEHLEDHGDKYYCKVTNKFIAKDSAAVERHVTGQRFQRYLEKAKIDALNHTSGSPETDDMDSEESGSEMGDSESENSSEDNRNEYPELAGSGSSDSEQDISAMDTEIDQRTSNKRTARKRRLPDSPDSKRKRQQ